MTALARDKVGKDQITCWMGGETDSGALAVLQDVEEGTRCVWDPFALSAVTLEWVRLQTHSHPSAPLASTLDLLHLLPVMGNKPPFCVF